MKQSTWSCILEYYYFFFEERSNITNAGFQPFFFTNDRDKSDLVYIEKLRTNVMFLKILKIKL